MVMFIKIIHPFTKPPYIPPCRKGGREVIVFHKNSKQNLESRHLEGGLDTTKLPFARGENQLAD